MQFVIGDQVVHPVHGVGTVKTISKQLFVAGKPREYYQVIIGPAQVWVPINEQGFCILRKIAPRESLDECRKVLRRAPTPLSRDHKVRELELAQLLKGGLLPALCETVRDLRAHGQQKPLGVTENELMKRLYKALSAEWAACNGVTVETALAEIESLLQAGR